MPSDSKFSDLLINGNEWNEQLIKSTFLPIDAELILKIPLPRVPTNDILVWHYEKKEDFTQLRVVIKCPLFSLILIPLQVHLAPLIGGIPLGF